MKIFLRAHRRHDRVNASCSRKLAGAFGAYAFLFAAGCAGDAGGPETLVPSSAARVGPDGQREVVLRSLPESLSLKVTDARGRAVSEVFVNWSVVAGGGSVSPATSKTDANGVAKSQWTLGPEAGEHRARGAVGDLPPVSFAAIALPVPVARVRVRAIEDSVFVDDERQMVASIEDSSGKALSGRTVSWSVSDTARASITTGGLLRIKRAGGVTISASSGGVVGTALVAGKWQPGLGLDYRAVKLWMSNNPDGMFAEYEGKTLDRERFESWKDVLAQIKRAGATTVVLQITTGVMERATDNRYSDTIDFNPSRASLEGLANDARALGLNVGISLFSNVFGVITGNDGVTLDRPSPTDPVLWMQDHRLRVLDWARFAKRINASSLVFAADEIQPLFRGTRLESQWLQLMRDIKREYSGVLTTTWYTPGHGDNLSAIPASIYNELDVVGIGFFPDLRESEDPTVAELCSAYFSDVRGRNVLGFLRDVANRYNKPLWITDKAFHSFKGASYREFRIFNPSIPLIADQETQVRLYESFLSVAATEGRGWLKGVAFQNFNNLVDGAHPYIARFVEGPLSESPQNKRAERVLSDWFNDRASSSCPVR